jgi:hypothetical protein
VHDVFRNLRPGFDDLVMETACGLHNLRVDYPMTTQMNSGEGGSLTLLPYSLIADRIYYVLAAKPVAATCPSCLKTNIWLFRLPAYVNKLRISKTVMPCGRASRALFLRVLLPSILARRARYRGLAKVHLQNIATAAAINLTRIVAWLSGSPRSCTRPSHFAALAV